MKRKLSRALAVAVLAAGMSVGVAQSPASADAGHCWRQGFGPVYANPGWSYQLRNICSQTINARVVLQDGHRLTCKAISAYGSRIYLSSYYSSYFWGENC